MASLQLLSSLLTPTTKKKKPVPMKKKKPVPMKKKKKPSPTKNTRKVVNRIVQSLHNRNFRTSCGIKAKEVFQGGSLGQGTAIPGHHDVDLVLYSKSLDYAEAVANDGYTAILKKIHSYLQTKLGGKYTMQEISSIAVKFRCEKDDGTTIDIDLLLSPFWATPNDQFTAMRQVKPPLKRLMFSASTSKWQTDFIRHQNVHVKELIRRAKAWRNVTWKDSKEGRPKSYLLSLLVIMAYKKTLEANMRTKRPKRLLSYAHEVTVQLKQLVKNIERDDETDLSIPGANEDLTQTFEDLLPDKPRIIDPVNPCNNLYLSGVGPVITSAERRERNKWGIFARNVDTIDLNLCAQAIMKNTICNLVSDYSY